MVNKKIVIVCTIIAILIFGCIFGYKIYKFNKDNNNNIDEKSDLNNNSNINLNKIEDTNTTENTVDENTITENTLDSNETDTTNTVDDNNTNTSSNNVTDTNTDANNKQEGNKSEDIAISIIKEKLGNKNTNVYFYVEEELENGVYIVSIRDSDTTAEIATYKVDINNKTVKEN